MLAISKLEGYQSVAVVIPLPNVIPLISLMLIQPLKRLLISVTESGISVIGTDVNEVQFWNNPLILATLDISQPLISKDVNEVQFENIARVLATFLTSHSLISKEVNNLQP